MFVTIELENIGPYTNKVTYDFKINKKDRKNLESTITLPDGTIISKVIGIISGNASGKSTLIDSLTSVGAFIDIPFKRKKMLSVEEFSRGGDVTSSAMEDYEKYYNFMQNLVPLISVNKSNFDNTGTIKLEMYIDSKNQYEGFYQYTIQYNNNVEKDGILMEKLEYKKKYSDKYQIIFNTRKGSVESEIGTKLGSKMNWIIELENLNMDVSSFEKRLNYYETFYNRYIKESSIIPFEYQADEEDIAEVVNNEKELFKKGLKAVDNSIKDIEVDIDTNEKKVFIIYENYKLRYDLLSTATKKVCDFLYNLVITSKKGGVLLCDEFDSSLNREVAKMLINIYFDSNIKRTGQFIFTAITPEIFDKLRRDQTFILTKENNKICLTRFDDFRNPENNQIVRNDYSFTKAYKKNIIKNYPITNSIQEFIKYMEERN